MSSVDRAPLRWSRGRFLGFAAAAGLSVAACSGDAGGEIVESAPPVAAEASSTVPSVLDGEFVTLAGDTIDLGSLVGQDVVFWFWAPW